MMRLPFCLVPLALLVFASSTSAHAQSALYQGGSLYDLDPPAQQSTGNGLLESLVRSRQAGNMRKIGTYAPDDLYRRLGRPVGRLAMAVRDREGSESLGFCTVSLIADDLILTNHHCIAGNRNGEVVDALLTMGYLSPGSARGTKRYGVELAPVEADEGLDYAIHRVRGKPGKTWGTIRLSKRVPGARRSLFIIHHPGGSAQHISLGNCQAGDPPTGADQLFHVCDTIGGSSGAPVFDSETREVVGLHYKAIDPGVLNAAKRVEELIKHSNQMSNLIASKVSWKRTGENAKTLFELQNEIVRLKAERKVSEELMKSNTTIPLNKATAESQAELFELSMLTQLGFSVREEWDDSDAERRVVIDKVTSGSPAEEKNLLRAT